MPYEQQYWSKYQKKMVKTVQLFSYFQFPTFISSFLIDNNASLKKILIAQALAMLTCIFFMNYL